MIESVCCSSGQLPDLEGSGGPETHRGTEEQGISVSEVNQQGRGTLVQICVTRFQCDQGQAEESPWRKESEGTEEGTQPCSLDLLALHSCLVLGSYYQAPVIRHL